MQQRWLECRGEYRVGRESSAVGRVRCSDFRPTTTFNFTREEIRVGRCRCNPDGRQIIDNEYLIMKLGIIISNEGW